eukprot:7025393-Karenia_brevis.AAC.1
MTLGETGTRRCVIFSSGRKGTVVFELPATQDQAALARCLEDADPKYVSFTHSDSELGRFLSKSS